MVSMISYGHMRNSPLIRSSLAGVLLLVVALVTNHYAGLYAFESASNAVTDIILSNIHAFDVDMIFIYGPVLFWAFVAYTLIRRPATIPFTLKSVAVFIFVRALFISLTHIGPFPEHIELTNRFFLFFSTGSDLFFSGHTGLPFLLALVFWKDTWLRITFILTSIFFGVIALLGHLHYSIDVAGAFFITYTIFHISRYFFPSDHKALEG
jgi:hypothetical protein